MELLLPVLLVEEPALAAVEVPPAEDPEPEPTEEAADVAPEVTAALDEPAAELPELPAAVLVATLVPAEVLPPAALLPDMPALEVPALEVPALEVPAAEVLDPGTEDDPTRLEEPPADEETLEVTAADDERPPEDAIPTELEPPVPPVDDEELVSEEPLLVHAAPSPPASSNAGQSPGTGHRFANAPIQLPLLTCDNPLL